MIFPQSHTLGLKPRPHGSSSRGLFPTGSHMEVALSSIKLHRLTRTSTEPLSHHPRMQTTLFNRRASIRHLAKLLVMVVLVYHYRIDLRVIFYIWHRILVFQNNLKFKNVNYFEKEIMFTLDVDMTKKNMRLYMND